MAAAASPTGATGESRATGRSAEARRLQPPSGRGSRCASPARAGRSPVPIAGPPASESVDTGAGAFLLPYEAAATDAREGGGRIHRRGDGRTPSYLALYTIGGPGLAIWPPTSILGPVGRRPRGRRPTGATDVGSGTLGAEGCANASNPPTPPDPGLPGLRPSRPLRLEGRDRSRCLCLHDLELPARGVSASRHSLLPRVCDRRGLASARAASVRPSRPPGTGADVASARKGSRAFASVSGKPRPEHRRVGRPRA